ncbi:MAG: aldose epimerase family protein [Sediminicola sp.]
MKKPKKMLYGLLLLALCTANLNCKGKKENDMKDTPNDNTAPKTAATISKNDFGETADGTKVDRYTLANGKGMEVDIITYGGIITSLKTADRKGKYDDVVLGFDSLSGYLDGHPYFGALIGRYGNRIANAKFELDGKSYSLAANDGPNHLHGGEKGFDKVVWNAKEVKGDSSVSLVLSYLSKDMEEGYPGNLATKVTYTLDRDNSLEVLYEATTDKKTVINLTQHSYFNLSGDFSQTILDHEVMINADTFLPVNNTLIPTGELRKVEGTPFDFREFKAVGKELEDGDDQLKKGLGYDHCWVLTDRDSGLKMAAAAHHPKSGRLLEVFTTEPAIQFYTGNFLDGTLTAKGGGTYAKRTGLCLETQHYPDSPNQQSFPSVTLEPGEGYSSKTIFKFSTK